LTFIAKGRGFLLEWLCPKQTVRPQESDYEYERKAHLVPGQEIRLGLGVALCIAGMGCNGDFCSFAFRGGCALSSWQAYWSVVWVGCSAGNWDVHYLPFERGETEVAMGRGLIAERMKDEG
jgi:hypothetical protein